MKKVILTLALFLLCFISIAQKLPFQGYLEESGVPVNGTRTFIFELTDYGWTETIADVPIDNGIYNVVLGETTLLPDTIFENVSETPLSITIDGTNIGAVMLYKPLGFNNSKFELLNDTNSKRGELLINEKDAGQLSLYGENDSLNIRLGSIDKGSYGSIVIYDSLGAPNGYFLAGPNGRGGYFQISKQDATGNFTSKIAAGANGPTSYLSMDGQNTTADGVSLMILNYITGREIAGGPQMSGNYKRSGTDWYDNEGRILAAVGTKREEGGPDPTGSSGYLSLWGTNSINAELTGKGDDNNDLPVFNMYGNKADGNGRILRNFMVNVLDNVSDGYNYSYAVFYNTETSGTNQETVVITSNLFDQKGGGMEINDSTGTNTIRLEGNSGNITANNFFGNITPINGSIFRLNYGDGTQFVNADPSTTRFVVHNPSGAQTARIFSSGTDLKFGRFRLYGNDNEQHYESGVDEGNAGYTVYSGPAPNFFPIARIGQNGINPEAGALRLYSNNIETVSIDSEVGKIFLPGIEAGRYNGENGLFYATGENNTAGDNIRVGVEVVADGLGSSNGRLFVKDATSTDVITLEGSTGTVTATTLTQTSDKRLKKDIEPLKNSLDNTLKLRGTSYYWKDEKKSQKRQIGVIAQEVEAVYPEFVHTNDEGFKSVNYAQMTAVLIEAMKELNSKMENMEKDVAELEKVINGLETENKALTSALNQSNELAEKINRLEKLLLKDQKVASN